MSRPGDRADAWMRVIVLVEGRSAARPPEDPRDLPQGWRIGDVQRHAWARVVSSTTSGRASRDRQPRRRSLTRHAAGLPLRHWRNHWRAPRRPTQESPALQADLVRRVHGLRVGEALTGRRRQLLDQASAREPAHRQVTLGGFDGLFIPVHLDVIDRKDGNVRRKPVTGRRRQLLD